MDVEVHNLRFGYIKPDLVLNGISFRASEGTVLAVLGGSGCGKSTLLRVICGILPRSRENLHEGSVTFDGEPMNTELRSRGNIGLMFQDPSLLPFLTVEDNIRFPLQMLNEPDLSNETDRLIDAVGLDAHRTSLPKYLSGGMQTRVSLARTLITKPRILLLDEPFSSLDYRWRLNLYNLFRLLNSAILRTTILVTHDISEAFLLADNIIVLSAHGTILDQIPLTAPKPDRLIPEAITTYLNLVRSAIIHVETLITRDGGLSEYD